MNVRRFSSAIFVLALIITNITTLAAEFKLTKIGALETGGKTYAEWWYTGVSPVLEGTAEPNDRITINIESDSYTVDSDSEGNWEYQMSVTKGDYDIALLEESGGSYYFTLHTGQMIPDSTTTTQTTVSATTTPDTGSNQWVVLGFSLGILLLGLYIYLWGTQNKKFAFEKKFLP